MPAGHYFMMGDNRDNSSDSRQLAQHGTVPARNILGRAELVYFSLAEGESVWTFWRWPWSVRWSRMFTRPFLTRGLALSHVREQRPKAQSGDSKGDSARAERLRAALGKISSVASRRRGAGRKPAWRDGPGTGRFRPTIPPNRAEKAKEVQG